MSNVQGRPVAIVCGTALALAVPLSEAYVRATAAGPGPQERWNTFSAEVTIRRGVRDAAQQPVGNEGPAVKYRWERTQSGGRWKTTMSVVRGARPDVVTPTGQSQAIPPVVARIEDEGDGAGPRFYSLQGTLLRPPVASDRQKMGASDSVFANTDALVFANTNGLMRPSAAPAGNRARLADEGREWVEAVLPSLEKKSARETALQQRFGKALGKLRGLDRYVQTIADETTEVLAHDDWGVPVEINVVRGGVLESHASFSYEAGPAGSLVRRSSHAEHAIKDMKGARMVLDVELANVKLEERR
jgi:hypothetical protein